MPTGRNLTLSKVKFFSQPLERIPVLAIILLHLGWSTQTKVKPIILQGPAVP